MHLLTCIGPHLLVKNDYSTTRNYSQLLATTRLIVTIRRNYSTNRNFERAKKTVLNGSSEKKVSSMGKFKKRKKNRSSIFPLWFYLSTRKLPNYSTTIATTRSQLSTTRSYSTYSPLLNYSQLFITSSFWNCCSLTTRRSSIYSRVVSRNPKP